MAGGNGAVTRVRNGSQKALWADDVRKPDKREVTKDVFGVNKDKPLLPAGTVVDAIEVEDGARVLVTYYESGIKIERDGTAIDAPLPRTLLLTKAQAKALKGTDLPLNDGNGN